MEKIVFETNEEMGIDYAINMIKQGQSHDALILVF